MTLRVIRYRIAYVDSNGQIVAVDRAYKTLRATLNRALIVQARTVGFRWSALHVQDVDVPSGEPPRVVATFLAGENGIRREVRL